jgi:UDP-glucose 4-epimerase
MRVCLVGGNGFIGSHLIDALRQSKHDVIVYDRQDERYRSRQPDVTYFYGELGNYERVLKSLVGVDCVVHLASSTTPQMSNEDMPLDVEQNLIGTLHLLQACVEKQVSRIVFISSGGTVYGIPRLIPIREDHPTEPLTSYGIVKLAIEKYLAVYARMHNLDYRILRPSNPYGERQNPLGEQGIISVFLWRALQNKSLSIFGDGNIVRDYIYIDDLSRAICATLEYRGPTRIFNVGSGHGYSINELIQTITRLFDIHPDIEKYPGRPFDIPEVILDRTLIEHEMNWQPQISLAEGLQRTKQWLESIS